MYRLLSISALFASYLMLCACAGTLVDAPSLNKRAFEISLEEMRTQASESKVQDDSILLAPTLSREAIASRVDDDSRAIWRSHNKADANFVSQSSKTQAIVRRASGAGFGSDNWSIAQVEISRLDRARAPSLKSLIALDKIIFAQLENKTASSEAIENLLQLQKFLQSDVETQNRFINNLSDSLAKSE